MTAAAPQWISVADQIRNQHMTDSRRLDQIAVYVKDYAGRTWEEARRFIAQEFGVRPEDVILRNEDKLLDADAWEVLVTNVTKVPGEPPLRASL